MTLANTYVITYGQLPEFFSAIQQGQAPEQFTQKLLKDLGFASTNHRAYIPLLKALGFLSPEGVPTSRYHDYRNKALAPKVMGEALHEAYSDLFVISENPSQKDRELIEGKFKSTHNVSDNVAERMAKTFFALLELADLSGTHIQKEDNNDNEDFLAENKPPNKEVFSVPINPITPSLHYDIQIHLPATKDIEVYNAIFKSLKEHLID